MALYGYYVNGIGLFSDNSGTWEAASDATLTASEEMLIAIGAQKLTAYKILIDTWEYAVNDKFALQPGSTDVYRFFNHDEVKFVDASYVTNATYFAEILYSNTYIL